MTDGAHKAQHLTSADFDSVILAAAKDGKKVFVDFFADWCGPCQIAAPEVEKMASDDTLTKTVVIAKVNVDEQQELAQRYQVMSIPTFVVFDADTDKATVKALDRSTGYAGPQALRNMIAKHTS